MLKANSMVITSKGNYGRVMSIGPNTAHVKIGYKVHEIELYNLIDVMDGTHFEVNYTINNGEVTKDLLFIKHGSILFDMYRLENPYPIVTIVTNALIKKLDNPLIKILKISIP